MALPHIQNSVAGRLRLDPVHSNLFEVRLTVPEILRPDFGKDELIITEHITKVTTGGALNRSPKTETQKFMGTDRSYIVPKLDNTYADLDIELTLNLRDSGGELSVDNYIYKFFRAWTALAYNVNTGTTALKRDYCADYLELNIANRAGNIFHNIIFKDIMLREDMTGWTDEFAYETNDAQTLNVKFRSDWWQEQMI